MLCYWLVLSQYNELGLFSKWRVIYGIYNKNTLINSILRWFIILFNEFICFLPINMN